jgi:hypothetical protein
MLANPVKNSAQVDQFRAVHVKGVNGGAPYCGATDDHQKVNTPGEMT